jgi:uncharacterized protein
MNTFGLSNRSYKLIIQVMASYPEIERVVIFGSRAMGNYEAGSDIDLALFGEKCTAALALEVEAQLNEKEPIPYYIDVVNFNDLTNPNLVDHIERVGIDFYKKSLVDHSDKH